MWNSAIWRWMLPAAAVLAPTVAWAAQPTPWQIDMQPAASPIMSAVRDFNGGLLIVITLIVLFVLALLVYVMMRFNERANPTPSAVSHNTLIEVVWTIVPILVLVGIAVPSFSLLFAQHDPSRIVEGFDPATDRQVVVKATGAQWYWDFEYPDTPDVAFSSTMLTDEDLAANPDAGPRLLAVDNEVIVPVGVVVRLQTTSVDVIHAFAMPAFGVKIDAVPGRLNETWFLAEREGVYYGQCSELCGQAHAFMPIAVRAVSEDLFDAWVIAAQEDLDGAYEQLALAIERGEDDVQTALAR